MDTSILQNRRFAEFRSNNFNPRRNVPLDVRFMVSKYIPNDSSSTTILNNEIPIELRYNGLIFFAVSSMRNNGTTDVAAGRFFYFGDDLTTPKPLTDTIYDFETIYWNDTAANYNYSTIIAQLNTTYAIPGRIVWFKKLKIAVVYDGTSWNYLAGVYNVDTEAVFNQLPSVFKQTGRLVLIGTGAGALRKIIKSDLTLSDELILTTTTPTAPGEHDRYYYYNNRLYHSIGGKMFLVSDGMWYNASTNLIVGKTDVNHNLASNNIIAYGWIGVPTEYHFAPLVNGTTVANKLTPYEIDYEVKTENVITIFSSIATTIQLLITTKN
jgi:hypothetical protein